MFDPIHSISMLADGDSYDSILQFGMFVLIALGSIIGTVVKKSAEKRQQEEARRKAEEAKGILARRAQREQGVYTQMPKKDATFQGKIQKAANLRDFIRSHADSAPPPMRQPKPSMFAAAPKPIPIDVDVPDHRMVELEPIEHLPPEEILVNAALPSEENHTQREAVAKFLRRRNQPASVPVPVAPAAREPQPMTNIATLTDADEPSAQIRVNLLDEKTARAAMIFHEILSTPKALRSHPEIWE